MPMYRKPMASSTDILPLKLLEREDMYGYQMIENPCRRSNDMSDMKAGTLYPLLHHLVERGYLTANDVAAREA